MKHLLYKLTLAASGKAYIGMTRNLGRRMSAHLAKRALPMEAGYSVEVLACALTRQDAAEAERQLVLQHATLAPGGHNQTHGGLYGDIHLSAAKKKIAQRAVGNQRWLGKKHTDEAKRKMAARKQELVAQGLWPKQAPHSLQRRQANSRGHLGQAAWNKGVPRDQATKDKISAAMKGKTRAKRKPLSEELKRRISEKVRGYRHSEEAKQKMRDAAAARRLTASLAHAFPPQA